MKAKSGRIPIVAGLAILASTNICAAVKITMASDGSPAWIHVVGPFEPGDGERFEAATRSLTSAIVVLMSRGVDADAGVKIGRIIHARKFTTLAYQNCESACAIAWLGGARRLMFETQSLIGFHAAYKTKDRSESGSANAVVGAYLGELGLSEEAIRYVTTAPPRSMQWFTPEDGQRYGIAVKLIPPAATLVLPPVPEDLAILPMR